MAVVTKLTEAEVKTIVDRVLAERWRAAGYDHADVVSEDDVYGEPALSVTVWMRPGSPDVPADVYIESAIVMRDAIRAEGEQRYPYLHLGSPDDPIVDDGDSDQP